MSTRLSVDIGGTFTDVVLSHAGRLSTVKVLTTYDDPARGVLQGIHDVLDRADVTASSIELVLHGTTLATNALIERRGAPTALITTAGHRDVLEMAFENRFEQYDVNIDRPTPLVPRHWRIGIDERVAADGAVLRALDEAQVLTNVDALVDQGVESIAIGFLHSYINSVHEERVLDLIIARHPGLSLSRSSDVCPEIREYERLSTTVANAYVKPLMAGYLASLHQQITALGINAQILMMTSGGGLTTLNAASAYPIRLVESGPAGGAMLAADLAQRHSLERVLSFDMGGTTAKIALIDDGEPQHSRAFEVDRSYRFKKGSGLPVRIPVIEMVEIGAGGGSIANIDGLQRIQVGPESAGSEPGPACYDLGGKCATVTDADVVLGKLSASLFAGGALSLNPNRASIVVQHDVADKLGVSTEEAAFMVSEIVEENMASAARAHAAEWGKGLQDRCLIAFGGAAPLHAGRLAQKLKISRMLIPQGAGVGSALGFLLAPVRFEVVRSLYARLDALPQTTLADMFVQMRAEAQAVIDGAGVQTEILVGREAFMRYVGQGYEVAVDISHMEALDEGALREEFERVYSTLYGRVIPGMQIEVLSWTLSLAAQAHNDDLGVALPTQDLKLERNEIVSFADGEMRQVPVVLRSALQTGERYQGPMLIVEAQTSTVCDVNSNIEVLFDGTLSIEWSLS